MSAPVTVIYNAACPICEGEMRHYKKRTREGDVTFLDLNTADLSPYGLTPDAAAKRLHVVLGSQVVGGIDAFLLLWRATPGMGWLARLVGLPGVRQVAGVVYDTAVAPRIYNRFRPNGTCRSD